MCLLSSSYLSSCFTVRLFPYLDSSLSLTLFPAGSHSRLAAIMQEDTDNNAEPCGLHCVNWLELVLLWPSAVFDVNMLEAWLSFVVIRLSAQLENGHCEGERESRERRTCVFVCICLCVWVRAREREMWGRIGWGNKRNWAWTSRARPYTALMQYTVNAPVCMCLCARVLTLFKQTVNRPPGSLCPP